MEYSNGSTRLSWLHFIAFILFSVFSQISFAEVIIIKPNTVIAHSKVYNNATLDLSNGSFLIKENATLTINNSTITGNISRSNPSLFIIERGHLVLNHNKVNVSAVGIAPHSTTQSLYHAIHVETGDIQLSDNHFQLDKSFTVGLLITNPIIHTANFKIVNNKFERFHGVLYLINTDKTLVSGNTFLQNTYGHIVIFGTRANITKNKIYFSGNNRLGNSIDIIDSDDIILEKNLLFTATCHGIYVLNSRHISIQDNRIYGGITYAITLLSFPEVSAAEPYIATLMANHKFKHYSSSNIVIMNNFMSQNRYGIAAADINDLVVVHNYFIQRFEDANARKFWTNNAVLLKNVTNLNWSDNLYKEAYTQQIDGDNSQSNSFHVFPVTGGIVL